MALERSAEVLPSVPEHRKAVLCLVGKYVSDNLHSGMSYSAFVGCKFLVN